jgi:hypothetical protein
MVAAAKALRQEEPKEIIVAVPVAARDTGDKFRSKVDHVVCAAMPEPFCAVSNWYEDFSETTDEEVRDLLERAARPGFSVETGIFISYNSAGAIAVPRRERRSIDRPRKAGEPCDRRGCPGEGIQE